MRPAIYLVGAAIYLVGLIFAAGAAWAEFRRVRKDLNGVGQKLRTHIDDERDEREALHLLLIQIAPEGKREQLVAQFLEGLRR
jgi:hypothetical protein